MDRCDIGYYVPKNAHQKKYVYLFVISPEQRVYARIGAELNIVTGEDSQTVSMETERRPLSWRDVPRRVTLFVPGDQKKQWRGCVDEIQDQFLKNNRIQSVPSGCRSLSIIKLPKFVD